MFSHSHGRSIAGKLKGIEDELNGLFNAFPLRGHMLRGRERVWHPPTDVSETATHFLICVEIPGVPDPDKLIDVSITENLLTVRGRRPDRCREQKVRVHQMEIHYGSFERSILLPRLIDGAGATADYTDGFVVIRVPKATEQRAASVSIRITP